MPPALPHHEFKATEVKQNRYIIIIAVGEQDEPVLLCSICWATHYHTHDSTQQESLFSLFVFTLCVNYGSFQRHTTRSFLCIYHPPGP